MNKNKKMMGIIAAGLIGAGSMFSGAAATGVLQQAEVFAATDVAINKTNFPDVNFRNYVSEKIDKNGDSKLNSDEIATCTTIDCDNRRISSLKGIEYFTALEKLYCYANNLSSLDVSKNTKLTELVCGSNNLSSLDVSKNMKLTSLNYGYNNLSNLDASKNAALEKIYCYGTNLISIDLNKNRDNIYLYCNNGANISINKGASFFLRPGEKEVRRVWSSSNATIASVDNEGKVTAKTVGTATITGKYVTSYTNETTTFKITVKSPASQKNGWKNENGGWKYYKDGKAYKGWHWMGKAEGEKTPHWSYFGSDGKLYTGWRNMGKNEGEKTSHWSYFGPNGWLRTGWQQMGKGTNNPDGNAGKHWSYFGSNGWLRTGWQWMDKSQGEKIPHWSYFGGNGWLRTGMVTLGKVDGEKVTHKSYFGGNGWLVTNKRFSVAGKTYTADSRGWVK